MEETVYKLVENTLKRDDALQIIAEKILWYEMQLLKKDERMEKVIKLIEDDYFEDGSFENYDEVMKLLRGDE